MSEAADGAASTGESTSEGGFQWPVERTLDGRWLKMAGVPGEGLRDRLDRADQRIQRYPFLIRAARFWAALFVDWLAPLIFLGRFRRASSLSMDAFAGLFQHLREHRWTTLRLMTLAVVAPLMEQLSDERETPEPAEHPLEGRLPEAPAVHERSDYDLIVIGSGAGGAPVAAQMAEGGAQVALVEKGGLVKTRSAPEAVEKYYLNQGMLGAVRGTPVIVMAASTLGGTTSVNSGTSLRPKQECLESWDAIAGTKFADGELDGWLERASEAINVMVPPAELRSTSARTVERGMAACGREDFYGLPRNVAGCQGSGACCFGCPTNAKQSTDRSFVPRALDAGADLHLGWTATDIREHGDRVEVRLEADGRRQTLQADRLVIAGGAIHTPGILRKNKLGSAWRRAGGHFKTHPATKVYGHFPDIDRRQGSPGIPQALGYDPPEFDRITMEGAELPKSMVGPVIAAGGGRFRWWMDHHHEIVSYGAMIWERATGRVRELFGQPIISHRLEERDATDLAAAMKLIAEFLFAAGAERVLLPMPGLRNEFRSAGDLADFEPTSVAHDQMLLSGFHPQGTAGMGRVVDADLKLKGSERIYVSDASVLPDSPGVNPQVTIIALALRLAEHLR